MTLRAHQQIRIVSALALGLGCSLAAHHAGPAVASEAGALDPSFGNGGITSSLFGDSNGFGTTGVALQPDGKVVVAGWTSPGYVQDFAVARFTASGQPDQTFAGDGTVITNLGGSEGAEAVAIAPDGKIVVAGGREPFSSAGTGFQFVRYLANGSLDTSFSGDGKLIVRSAFLGPSLDRAYAVAVQPDGKILAAGRATNDDAAVVRLTPSGALDRTFSGDGIALLPRGGYEVAYALGLQPDGKIVIAGSHSPGTGGFHGLVGRFTSTGAVDTSFGTNGSTTTPLAASFRPFLDLVIQPDGKIAAAGQTSNALGSQMAVVRYTAQGALDSSFSQDGIVTSNSSNTPIADALVLQADGKLVAVVLESGRTLLARYLPDGSPDPSFGFGGLRELPGVFGGPYLDGAIQPDGRLVLGCCGGAVRILMEAVPTGPSCDGFEATVVGTAGNDTLTGNAGPDVIVGGPGNDTIQGLGEGDRICGGDGDDIIAGGAGNDRIFGEAGNDQLFGMAGSDAIDGGAGVDLADFNYAAGPVNANLATGSATGEGTDFLAGLEWVAGGAHNDELRGDAADNRLYGRGGNDNIFGADGSDGLSGGAGTDLCDGGTNPAGVVDVADSTCETRAGIP